MFARYYNHQSGDTIIEVLVSIAIASSVLALTYVTMNRNLLLARDSQERTEASKLTQGQIEALKALSDGGTVIPSSAFCISGGVIVALNGGAPTADFTVDDFSDYPAACVNGFYRYGIKQDTSDTGLYRFYVRWERVDGKGRNQVAMVYRL